MSFTELSAYKGIAAGRGRRPRGLMQGGLRSAQPERLLQ